MSSHAELLWAEQPRRLTDGLGWAGKPSPTNGIVTGDIFFRLVLNTAKAKVPLDCMVVARMENPEYVEIENKEMRARV